MRSFILILCVYANFVLGKKGYGPTDQEWGYTTVREGAYMFWWLHYTTATGIENPADVPLVIWLQGGPGASSTGYGNFGEIGPLDEYSNEREFAWTKICNVLFVDNPVGSGFSYVDDSKKYTTNNTEIAEDFLVFLRDFYQQFPKFNDTPLYIFSESYGGKMTVEIAELLHGAQKSGIIACNFKGIGLGDPWISPVDSILTWAPYLQSLGMLDDIGFERLQQVAEDLAAAVSAGDFKKALRKWGLMTFIVEYTASNVDVYNVLKKVKPLGKYASNYHRTKESLEEVNEDLLQILMNTKVKKALGLNRTWISLNDDVNHALRYDFMIPVTEIVEKLLNETELEIVVYNGQLDLIVDTPGTIKWVNELKWNGTNTWKNITHSSFTVDSYVEGFYKNLGTLTFYWVSRAGHMVPYDNPQAMNFILKNTISKNPKIQRNGIR